MENVAALGKDIRSYIEDLSLKYLGAKSRYRTLAKKNNWSTSQVCEFLNRIDVRTKAEVTGE